MLSPAAAAKLIAASPMFDYDWYTGQVGRRFLTTGAAIRDYVGRGDDELSPHPLFEPAWLYPGARWRGLAPDPLTFWLSRPTGRSRSPHPNWDSGLGDLATWLESHDPHELLPAAAPRSPIGRVLVRLPGADPVRAIRWIKHLSRTAGDVTIEVLPEGPTGQRLIAAVAAERPQVRLEPVDSAEIELVLPDRIDPPRWPWVPQLLAPVLAGEADAATPLFVDDTFVVAGPVLAGQPISDAERIDGVAIPGALDVVARRVGTTSEPVLVAASRLVVSTGSTSEGSLVELVETTSTSAAVLAQAGFDADGRPLQIREGMPALRWSIDIAAGAGPIGTRWGDFHFARSLQAALEGLGQWVALDHPETRERASRAQDDVVLTLRGLERVSPPAHSVNLLWVISHPDEVTAEEVAGYDAVFAASTPWAAAKSEEWGTPVRALLQCTDPSRFHPAVVPQADAPETVFVANARATVRPAVSAAIRTGTPVSVIGAGWDGVLPQGDALWTSDRIANEDLPALYAGAKLVLADHHEDMRQQGFVANRIFDVIATGTRVLSDDVVGLAEAIGQHVPTWSTDEQAAAFGQLHSFEARARVLLDTAFRLRHLPAE